MLPAGALRVEETTAISHIAFRDPEAAARNLERIAGRAPREVAEALPTLLAGSPDPDAALNLFEKLCEQGSDESLRLLDRHRGLIHYALAVFGYSQFLGETLIQNPDLLQQLAREKNLDRSHSREDFEESLARFRTRSFEADISLALARFKRREYVRIMLRDVLGLATLAEVTGEISALSDVLLAEALREADSALRKRYGPPRHNDAQGRLVETPFAVLSLGKLGGNELNYSSDVDLMFLHGDGEPPAAAEISNREYFIRLAQQTTELLSRLTREGPVFRIDLRLRPQGSEGEPAVSLGQALRYYSEAAHDWELQAMIKARHSAGDLTLARQFLRGVLPCVYRAQLNFLAIETALDTREKISTHRRRKAPVRAAGLDVKLDRGGIRDIEFLVQCLQRVYGGEELWLRSGGTLFSLQKLHDKGHLSGKDFHDLNSGYEFLRRVEHRLQLRQGQQTHRLPHSASDLRVLARSVVGPRAAEAREGIEEEVRRRMAAVAEIYHRVIHRQHLPKREDQDSEVRLRATVAESGKEQSFKQILEHLAGDSPQLYEIAARRDLASHTRRNLQRFLSAALTSSERYAAVSRAPQAVERALQLLAVSDGLTEILIRHPEEIRTLEDLDAGERDPEAASLFPEAGGAAGAAGDPVFAHIAAGAAEQSEKMALLRRHSRHRVFAAGVRDLAELRPVYESLEELTAAADDAIAAALGIAEAPAQFAVLALGRLGSREFDIASDADLLFLREEKLDARKAARAAERMVEVLAAYTRDGTVFAVDPRLRPRGGEGELVVTPTSLASYFATEVQAWEALTYTKLRFVAGSERLAGRAMKEVEQGSARFAGDPGFPAAVREMRRKLEKAESNEPGSFKTGPGGFYDIDFVASYLMVRHGMRLGGNIRERLHGLAAQGRLSDNDCATLDSAAELLRTLEHVVRLVTGRARKSLPAAEHARETVERLTRKLLRREFAVGLEGELARAFTSVRAVYERVLAAGEAPPPSS
jgi:glutamate-ammonia-ligase adenylyltransferase